MVIPYLLFAMVFAGPGVSVTPTFVDRYASHEDCDQAGKDIRLTIPPSDKVLYWSMCVRAGAMPWQTPSATAVEAKKEPEAQQRKGWGR